jgi:uncharacterized membrane protein
LLALGTVAGIGYPLAVYFARDAISARSFVLVALALLGVRVFTLRSTSARLWRWPILLMAGVLIGSAALDPVIAEKAYPATMSLAAALVFAWSLNDPPSLIERFARLRRRDLPAEASAYCRKVTMVWALWLLVNAAISAGLALWGSLASWAVWTGLFSYLGMGLLFVCEMIVRRFILGYRPSE